LLDHPRTDDTHSQSDGRLISDVKSDWTSRRSLLVWSQSSSIVMKLSQFVVVLATGERVSRQVVLWYYMIDWHVLLHLCTDVIEKTQRCAASE